MIKDEIKMLLRKLSPKTSDIDFERDFKEYWNQVPIPDIENKTLNQMTETELEKYKILLKDWAKGEFA